MTADHTLPDRLKTGQRLKRPQFPRDVVRIVQKTNVRDEFGEPCYRLKNPALGIMARNYYSRDDLAALGFALVEGGA